MTGRLETIAITGMALVAVVTLGCSEGGEDTACDGSAAVCGPADASTSSSDHADGRVGETGPPDAPLTEPTNDAPSSDGGSDSSDAPSHDGGDAPSYDGRDVTVDLGTDLTGSGTDADAGDATDGGASVDVSVDSTDGSDAGTVIDVTHDLADGVDDSNSDGSICAAGEQQNRSCGNCGIQTRTCTAGSWSDWTTCGDEGICIVGTTENEVCGSDVGICKMGTRSRSCSSSCQWNAWTACGGAYVGPTLEICNDALDNDCSGTADEGCSCAPVAKGGGGSLVVTGTIAKLIADPQSCLVYGLDTSSPSSIVVFDTKLKTEMKRVALPSVPIDFDISPSGAWLVASLGAANQIAVVDKNLWTATLVTATSIPYPIEVTDAGYAYYAPGSPYGGFAGIHGIDLGIGVASDVEVWNRTVYSPDFELDPRGPRLYRGESGLTSDNIEKDDLSTSPPTVVDRGNWNDNLGFSGAYWHVYLGAKNVYFASHAIAADQLSFVRGKTDSKVMAEDEMGTFAVSNAGVIDAELVRTVAPLPQTAEAATLTWGDHETWYFNAAAGRVYYANVLDFLDGKALGERALFPLPLSNYSIAKLVADPVRPRLYALDATREVVVAIDSTNMSVIGVIAVSSVPKDIEVDGAGNYLYIAHLETNRIGQIDLTNWRFARLIPAPREFGDIAPLGEARLAGLDWDQANTPTLMQVATGAVTDSKRSATFYGAIAATGDGNTLFVAGSSTTAETLTRYAVGNGKLTAVGQSPSYGSATRGVVATRDGTGVYWAGRFFDGTFLGYVRYLQPDAFVTITPDGKLATSATKVYRVADGAVRGDLPVTGAVQAAKSDSTKLYVVNGGTIGVVDLTSY